MSIHESKVFGLTGVIGKDGYLTPDLEQTLNTIQENAANKGIAYLDKRGPEQPHPLVAMATGIGKGNIIHRVIEKTLHAKPNSRVLVIAGVRTALVAQTRQALQGYQEDGLEDFEYIEAEESDPIDLSSSDIVNNFSARSSLSYLTGTIHEPVANVHVTTIQRLQSEMREKAVHPSAYDLLIVDEVHNIGTPPRKRIVDQFNRVIGFTATPFRHSGIIKTPEQYGFTIVESLPLPEAQQLGLLPPLVGMQVDTKSVVDVIPTTATGGIDYKKLEKLLKTSPDLRPYIADRIADLITAEGKQYKTMVAVNFVWEAQEMAELLAAKGIKVGIAVNKAAARQIHTDQIPAIDSLERYGLPSADDASVQVLISPYVAGEGFDAPFTEVLVWASPTDSSIRYTQYTGRLARRAPGKAYGIVMDCLYQTDQYNWSYNMAMWMKGNIKQLDNGLLILGRSADVEVLRNQPEIERIRRYSAVQPLEKLQVQTLLDVQETDFPITHFYLSSLFEGRSTKLVELANNVMSKLTTTQPDLFARRRNKTRVVDVATDQAFFIEQMLAAGAKLLNKEITLIQEGELPLSNSALENSFQGSRKRILEVSEQVIEELEGEFPGIFAIRRRPSRHLVQVATNSEIFIGKMKQRGIFLKDSEIRLLQPNDFSLTWDSLESTFMGDVGELRSLARTVLDEITEQTPELITSRKSGNHTLRVVTDKGLFVQRMVAIGARIRETDNPLPLVLDTDFPLSSTVLNAMFEGTHAKIDAAAQSVINDLRKKDPNLIEKKMAKNKREVYIVKDPKLFISLMESKGVVLKPSPEEVPVISETDFPVSLSSVDKFFRGGKAKLKPIVEDVIGDLKARDTTLLGRRRLSRAMVDVTTDRELFFREMIKRGAELKNPS